jgi:hypothetical protein
MVLFGASLLTPAGLARNSAPRDSGAQGQRPGATDRRGHPGFWCNMQVNPAAN